jgi:hypothetical protein
VSVDKTRLCLLCREDVPAFGPPDRSGHRFLLLRDEHATKCTGSVSLEDASDALVLADAFLLVEGDEERLAALPSVAEIFERRQLEYWRQLARALYEKKYPHQAKIQETADLPGVDTHSTGNRWKPHEHEAARGWFSLRSGVAARYTCRYCRVEICEAVGGDPANKEISERLADRHALLCALHIIGGLREPTLSATRNPDPERPDFK